MVSKKEVKELFDLAEVETREEELRRKALLNEEIEAEKKALMLEYVIEHLHPSALIAVHQTNHFPKGGKLKPTGHFLLDLFQRKNPKRIIEDLQLKYPRMTIHFTLNYPVEGVAARGQWVTWEGKYAVLIPVKDFIERVVCLNPVDTWIIGELNLPASAEILMPEDEYYANPDDWKALAGRVKVVPYPNNENIHEAIKKRILKRGYAVTYGHDHSWYEGSNLFNLQSFIRASLFLSSGEKDRLIALAVKKGYQNWNQIFWAMAAEFKKRTTSHWKTKWAEIELLSSEIYSVIFDPNSDEKETPARNMKLKLETLTGKAESSREEVQKIIEQEKEFTSKEEKASLNLLVSELDKIKNWLIEILRKIEGPSGNITWEKFLEQEKII
ncbi:MAG: hypothetical protein AABW48_02490 [Nanoarchaeota archaeon]